MTASRFQLFERADRGLRVPTTINPIVQNWLRPVRVDIELGTYNAIPRTPLRGRRPKKRAMMMAHILGERLAR